MVKFLELKRITDKYAEEIHEAVLRTVDSGWYLQGEENHRFERDYAQYTGTEYAVGCANGLDALIWIFRAYIELGIMQRGDEVIVPAHTFIATLLAITENGLVPVFVEPRLDTYQIDDSLIEKAITPRTKAVCIVHLYGQCAYTERVGKICKQYGLKLVEDNAQAHGCLYKGRRTGSLGDAAGHSFYPGKNLGALGDGGMVTTQDSQLAQMVRILANYGSQIKYNFAYTGRNSRLDEMQAAILGVKLRHLDQDNACRRQVARYYLQHIVNPKIILPQVQDWDAHVFHIFPIRCTQRDALRHYLDQNGIQTVIHYPIPPHKQQCYAQWNDMSLPITEQIHREELSLPMSPMLTMAEADVVVKALNQF